MSDLFFPYQKRWLADTSRVRVWEKSRRIGASWACAFEAMLDAMSAGGCSTYYVSYNLDVCQEFIRDVTAWARAFRQAAAPTEVGEEKDDSGNEFLTYTVRFPSGHSVVSLSSRPSNLRSRRGRILIDEAAHAVDLEETLKAAMAILMWGGRVDLISTHNGVGSAFNKIVVETRAGVLDYSLHRTTIDDALAEGLYRRICEVTGQPWSPEAEARWLTKLLKDYGRAADEELRCNPCVPGGCIFKRDGVNFWKDRPKRAEAIQSWDMAFKGKESSDFVVGQVWARDGGRYFLLDQVRGKMGFSDTCKAVEALSAKWPRARKKLVEDAANGAAIVDALHKDIPGFQLVKPCGGKVSRANAVEPLWASGNVLLPEPVRAPWVKDLIEEIVTFNGEEGNTDDAVDAMTQALNHLHGRTVDTYKAAMANAGVFGLR